MPENPYLVASEPEAKDENPYLSAKENPYLKAADIPLLSQGQPPTMLERGKEAVTDFFRKDPGLGPLSEEDYAAFKPADVSIPEQSILQQSIQPEKDDRKAAEPINPALAMAGLTPEDAAMGRPVSTITGEPVPTFEEEAAGGRAAMAIIPYGFASAVRGVVPGALERAVMDPITKAVVGKEYVSPIDEALKIGKYLPEGAQAAIGVPAHMAGAIVPLSVSFKTAGAIMKAAGLPTDLVLTTGPVMDQMAGHVARGGIAGAIYGGLEGGTPQDMAEDAAFFGVLEGSLGAAGKIFKKLFSSNWYRNLEVKERGLVVQSADDLLRAGHSEGTILRTLNDPAERTRLFKAALQKRKASVDLTQNRQRFEENPLDAANNAEYLDKYIQKAKQPKPPVPVVPGKPMPIVKPVEMMKGEVATIPKPVPELPAPDWEVIKEGKGVGVMVKAEKIKEPAVKEEKLKAVSEKVKAETPTMLKESDKVNDVTLGTLVDMAAEDPAKALEHAADATVSKARLIEGLKNKGLKAMGEAKSKEERIEIAKNLEETLRGIEEGKKPAKQTDKKFQEFVEKTGYKLRSEEIGQDILDTLEDLKVSPQKVSERFWKEIYPDLSTKLQKKFESQLRGLTGMKPGDPLATKNGKTIYSKSWQEIAEDFLPEKIEHLEGPERGYVALMTDAVNRFAKPKEPVAEAPAKEPWELDASEWEKALDVEHGTTKEDVAAKIKEEGLKLSPPRIPEGETRPAVDMPDSAFFLPLGSSQTKIMYSEILQGKINPKARSLEEGTLTFKELVKGIKNPETSGMGEVLFRAKEAGFDIVKFKRQDTGWVALTDNAVNFKSHKQLIKEALKSGKLTPEAYAKLHAKNYGPLAAFMPKIEKKPIIKKPKEKKNIILWRGEEAQEGTYKLGKGLYLSEDKSKASMYGKPKAYINAYPERPLALRYNQSIEDWLLEQSGERNIREFNKKHDITEFIKSKGYDGVIDSTNQEIVNFDPKNVRAFKTKKEAVEAIRATEPLSETKSRLLANIKNEKGSSELINDLSRLGTDAIKRGHTSFKAFSAEMKSELSGVWEKIKSLIRKAYFAAKKIIATVKKWNEKPDTWEVYEKKSGEIVDILKPGENKIDYADIDILLGIDKTYGIRKAKKIPVEMLPKIIKSERGAVEIGKPKVERKKPRLTQKQKEQRAKKKAIKEKQLKIESAEEAKKQVHAMIRDRRQNLNLSAYDTNLFVNDIEQQTSKVQREIIPFIIEKTDIPKSLNRPDLEKAYKKDKDDLTVIARQVKEHFDTSWLKMKKNIPDMSVEQIENYVTHIWDLNKDQKRIVTNWFTTQNRFLKKRYIETLKEGIDELGLTPKVLDIGEIIRIHDGVASRAIENVKFVEGLKGLKHEGMSLIARADLAPQNWVYFDHPALRRGLVIPGKLKMGEKVSPELSNLLAEMGVAIGRRISPVAFGKPVGKAGEYRPGEPPEVRFQRFMSNRTIAHEIGHHLDETLGLGYKFLNNYASELYAINRERIESKVGKKGKYGEDYARSTEEQIAEFFATLFTDASKAYRIAPNATADALNRLRQDEVLSKLIDFDFEKQAKNLIEEQVSTLVKLPIKVHPDLEKPLKVIFESRIDHPAIQAYEVTNGVLKKTNLSLSLFHHGALGETGIAIMGLAKTLNIYFNPVKIYRAMAQNKFDIFEKEPIARDAIGHGLQVGATADIPVNMIQSKLNNLARMTKNVPLINKTTEFVRTFNEVWDKALWNYLHDNLKLYAYESLVSKVDPAKNVTKQKQEITQFINDTFGGQNWDTLMVSPKSLQIMTWSLLSADWTTSTVRQALSPTGIGKIHKETAGLRRKLGAYFWIKAGLYFGAGINMLNYTFRERDEKENPKYYEGMGKRTFLDKTMAGNTMGHKTHLFVGRHEDGTERYIRWGKQFRELPELLFDDTGFSPISATFKKVGGKLAPMIQLTSKITTGTSPSGFRDDDIYGKKGWDRVYGMGKVLIKSPLPFATRALFQKDKKFHLTDLAMPSSKGMTRWKSINLFKHAITKRDDRLLKETYQFTLMNNLPAYTLFSTALTILKAESTREFNEGVKTIEDVKKMLDKVDNPKDLIRLGNKLKRTEKENIDRKLGMDLLDQAIEDIKEYEVIEGK